MKHSTNSQLTESFRFFKSIKLASILVFVVSFCLSLMLFIYLENRKDSEVQSYFDYRSRDAINKIEKRLHTYETVLRGTKGLFLASNHVTRDEFKEYVDSLMLNKNYPGIQGVGFSLRVMPWEKAEHTRKIRSEGFPQYNVWPAGEREFYTSIIYLEPFEKRNLQAFGYDMYSNPTRRDAMNRSRDNDEFAMSGKVRLVQEDAGGKEQAGFLIYTPLYKKGLPHKTLDERRQNLLGWVYSPFRVDDLIHGIFGEWGGDIDVEIFDGSVVSMDTIMYDSDDSRVSAILYEKGLFKLEPLLVSGHKWTVFIRALPGFYKRVDTYHPLFFGLIGFVISIILTFLSWVVLTSRERAEKTAREMNHSLLESQQELKDVNSKLQVILDSAEVGVGWFDENNKIEYLNDKFTMLFGYTKDDIPNVDTWYQLAYPDKKYRDSVVPDWVAMVVRCMKTGEKVDPIEVDINCKNGRTRHVIIMTSIINLGNSQRVLSLFHDITARNLAETMLMEKTNELELFFNISPDLIAVISPNGEFLKVNRMWEKVLGYSHFEIIGKHFMEFLLEEDYQRANESFSRLLREGEIRNYDLGFRAKDGSVVDIEWEAVSQDGRLVKAAGRNVTERKKWEAALKDSEEKFRTMANSAPVLIYQTDSNKFYTWVNKGWLDFTGRPIEKELGNGWAAGVHPDDYQHYMEKYIESFDGRQPFRLEYRLKRNDGSYRWLLDSGVPLIDSSGQFSGYLGTCIDVTEEKEILREIEEKEAWLRAILDNSPYLIWLKDTKGRFLAVNKIFMETAQKESESDIIGKTDYDLWPRDIAAKYIKDDNDVISTKKRKYVEEKAMDKGEVVWMETFKTPIINAEEDVIGTAGFSHDITERRKVQEKVEHEAHHDPLTDLPNRSLFRDRLKTGILRAKREKTRLAVLFVDLDKFKEVNDTMGHDTGDKVLIEVAHRLNSCLRESDTVARFGGDEFTILISPVGNNGETEKLAHKIQEALIQPFEIQEKAFHLGASVGISYYPEHGESVTELIKNADSAMYEAKELGRNRVVVYH